MISAMAQSFLPTIDAMGGVVPLEWLPCANRDLGRKWNCPNDGKLFCSSCRLVAYCAKSCQNHHWKEHKQDCKNKLLSPKWQPAWVIENRDPSFITDSGPNDPDAARMKYFREKASQHGLQMHLWGNMPAMDILRLPQNEGAASINRDFNLAFVASGDLRHFMRTVNELPEDYNGSLRVILNDKQPVICIRNLIILIILAKVDSIPKAAEVALHLWYSAFVQLGHPILVLSILREFFPVISQPTFKLQLGEALSITASFSEDTRTLLRLMISSDHDVHKIQEELDHVFSNPARVDLHHRRFSTMEPSHRLAFQEFRRFGLLLPFGAPNAQFNRPNRFLFSPLGDWLQSDGANPLASWDPSEVIAGGKLHGARHADIFGCLYFFLSDQLRKLADRLRRFNISIHLFDHDASDLAKGIISGDLAKNGIPSDIRFDRIEVSNILDVEYLGIPRVLAEWGPLLSQSNPHATLLGYLMNWFSREQGGRVESSNPSVIRVHLEKLYRLGRLKRPSSANHDKAYETIYAVTACEAIFDNSQAYIRYLGKQKTSVHAKKVGLRVKERHTITPHRLFAPLDGASNAVPVFPDDESWYLNVRLSEWTFSERFLEFSPTNDAK